MTMKMMNSILLLLFLSFPVLSEEEITFSYAFLYKSSSSQINTIDCTKAVTTLSASDQLKLFIKHEPGTYLYLFLHEAEGGLYLIYPRFFSDFDQPEDGKSGFYFPAGFEWLRFTENPGEERFYFIVSSKRLSSLEKKTDLYLAIQEQRGTGSAYDLARKSVIEEIQRLRIEHFEYINKVKGELHFAAGEFRGFEQSFEFPVHRIHGTVFYARTIRIAHESLQEEEE